MTNQLAVSSIADGSDAVNAPETVGGVVVAQLALFYQPVDDGDDAPDYAGVDAWGVLLEQCAGLDCVAGLHLPHAARSICQFCGELLPWLERR